MDQFLEILQLPITVLRERVQQELQENPVLDLQSSHADDETTYEETADVVVDRTAAGEYEARLLDDSLSSRGQLRQVSTRRNPMRLVALVLILIVSPDLSPAGADEKEDLFVATPLTEKGAFTEGIEGPACDAQGNVYAVNFARQHTIGKVTPGGKAEVFMELPNKSVGNGIVFDRKGMMYVADYVNHNVLRIDPKTRAIAVFSHHDEMNQPNDLAIAPDGTLYASDPNWAKSTGQIWRIDTAGKVTLAAPNMGTTNGIEVSPDGKTLYVNESVQRNIWAFAIAADGALTGKRLVKRFDDHGFDGMRCDIDGNLYVTRYGKGTVVKLSPDGKVLREIDVLGKSPSNLCFGGPDGRTVYVTEVQHRRLVQFRVDRPGLAWQRWQAK
jgi:sugar lactone lactonase YvrE